MGERTDQIEHQINRTRGELNENFSELEQKVKSAFDWRTQFEERPMTLLAMAFGGGLLASAILPSRSSRRKRHREERPEVSHRANSRADLEKPAPATNGNAKPTFTSFDAFKGALVTVAARRLGGVIGDFLSGYREELHKGRQYRTTSDLKA